MGLPRISCNDKKGKALSDRRARSRIDGTPRTIPGSDDFVLPEDPGKGNHGVVFGQAHQPGSPATPALN